ncbi:Proton-coupled amino acid transporter-like protein pathetic [Pseudolycoriella hygida]|uniref:Proton-coupled amino acid transporter-like protein pathetic n=1 Tax=Pseudolycoriella hygida TaxID=35572 RepID=A0A9Q0NAH3_9DIPT|nr:Proton-coupled amino acid transporter-like protein pathetic [Pseudolycoriella hygida]
MDSLPSEPASASSFPIKTRQTSQDNRNYNPFEHRKVQHPTTDSETLIHLIKGSLGSGIVSMPLAFSNAGLWFGLGSTFVVGAICTYCVHILVKCAHLLSRRAQIPSLDYAGIAETAFSLGPKRLNKLSRLASFAVKFFMSLYTIGGLCVYTTIIAHNIKQVVEFFYNTELNIRLYLLMLLLPLSLTNLVRELKFLVWYSLVANTLMGLGLGVALYFILSDLPPVSHQYAVAHVSDWPKFFGTVIFAIEGISVVISLENNMQNPDHFIGCPGVLNIGMTLLVTLYAIFGFLGFLKYGTATEGSITLNLPVENKLAQSVKLMIAISIFLTYSLQFYVPVEIFRKRIKKHFKVHLNLIECGVRVALVTLTVVVAIIVPNIGPFTSLIGAVCLSTLGIIFPAVIETITYWNDPGMGRFNWRLIKNSLLVLFGIVGFLSGAYVSILEIITINL